jgi:multidrug resistance efflux pump
MIEQKMTEAPKRPILVIALIAVATIAAVLLVLYIWRLPPFRTSIEMTENAYVRGSVTVIAPKVDGYVAEVLVQDFVTVKKGQVLVRLDSRIYEHKLEQAKGALAAQEASLANLTQTKLVREATLDSAGAQIAGAKAQVINAEAQLVRSRADMERVNALIANESLSARERDQTVAALRQTEAAMRQTEAAARIAAAGRAVAVQDLRSVGSARAALHGSVEAARAAVRLAEIDLENTRVLAPRDGEVGEVGVKLGQYVTPGTQLMAVVPTQVWVIANFKEAQTSRMAAGQPARLQVDALGDAELRGTVERLSPATGSEFSVIKQDNSTGNFTKIPQRLLIRIAVDPGQALASRLRPGMSVVTRVDTSVVAGDRSVAQR